MRHWNADAFTYGSLYFLYDVEESNIGTQHELWHIQAFVL